MELLNQHKRKATYLLLSRFIHNNTRYVEKLDVLCMPGISGYEIEYFNSYKQVNKIFAIERDEEIFNELQIRYRDLISQKKLILFKGEVKKFLFNNKHKFDLIYLDYYSTFSAGVQNDLKIIMNKRLLNPGGKLAINSYGAREDIETQFENKINLEFMENKFKVKIDKSSSNIRAIIFNAFILKNSVDFKVRFYIPGCHTYISNGTKMWMFWTTYIGEESIKASTLRNAITSKDTWLWNNKQPLNIESDTYGVKKLDKINILKKSILEFYNENHYTPTLHELHIKEFQFFQGYSNLIKELDLCPRVNATKEEIEKELNRILKREGKLSIQLLTKAKLAKRNEFKNIKWQEYGLTRSIVDNYKHNILAIKKRRLNRIEKYLNFLDEHDHKYTTKFAFYGWIRKNNLIKYPIAKKEMLKLKKELEVL